MNPATKSNYGLRDNCRRILPQRTTTVLHDFKNHFPSLLLVDRENNEEYAEKIYGLHENIEF